MSWKQQRSYLHELSTRQLMKITTVMCPGMRSTPLLYLVIAIATTIPEMLHPSETASK